MSSHWQRAKKEVQPSHVSTSQSSTCIQSDTIPLAKASHMNETRVQAGEEQPDHNRTAPCSYTIKARTGRGEKMEIMTPSTMHG